MANKNLVLVERNKQDTLVPMITFVPGLSQQEAIHCNLSHMALLYEDCRNKIRKPDLLEPDFILKCQYLLDEVISCYLKVQRVSLPLQMNAVETASNIVRSITKDHAAFLKHRLTIICQETVSTVFWNTLASPSYAACFSDYSNGKISYLQCKRTVDFAILIITLTVLYGCDDDYYSRIVEMSDALDNKHGKEFPATKRGLYLWPLDFSFMENDADLNIDNIEHRALLKAARVINPGVKVQPCTSPSLLWARDTIAWVGNDLFVAAVKEDTESSFGCGQLSEGGNIIVGDHNGPFIFVSQEAFSDVGSELAFTYEMDMRNIQTYSLPAGFLWARDPVSQTDYALDSIHIDTVINFIPSSATCDEKPKVIIDPFYHSMIRNNETFTRFLDQKSITGDDIVIVDESERYLNLPNFSILPDQNGVGKFLFNKDKGLTIPKLHLKPGILVQPDIEIVNMASAFGTIRCATNMLPISYVNEANPTAIMISDNVPTPAKVAIANALGAKKHLTAILSSLFVSRLVFSIGPQNIPWEYDYFSSTGYIYFTQEIMEQTDFVGKTIAERMESFSASLSGQLGMEISLKI